MTETAGMMQFSGELKSVETLARALAEQCVACGACTKVCDFLARYGTPRTIARQVLAGESTADPFLCSLCGLCGAVCPASNEAAELFLAMRRRAAQAGQVDWKPYRPLLTYETVGKSGLFSLVRVPQGGRTVFFPGCSLPGTRPRATWSLWQRLRATEPGMGVAQGCCAKPSHDLGRQTDFEAHFGNLREKLLRAGVRTVVTACPNCHKVFSRYGGGLAVETAWERLAAHGGVEVRAPEATVAVHDPCPLRRARGAQDAARDLLAGMGLEVAELRSRRKRTLCCGEGGTVLARDAKLALAWSTRLAGQADGRRVVTACAGCAGFLRRGGVNSLHLADVLHDPSAALEGKSRVSGSPATYLNRLRLKLRWWLQSRGG